MDRKIILQLANVSYTDGSLDKEKVKKIASLLNRKSLKQYIKALKMYQRQHSVFVQIAYSMEYLDESVFEELFPDKEIIIEKDQSLLLGIKITNNDLVYERNLKNTFDQLEEKIKRSYD